MSGRSPGATLAKKSLGGCLADFGPFGLSSGTQDGGKMAEMGAKMEHRWRQDGLRWGLSGHLEADWGVILSILGGLAGDLCRLGRSVKMSTTMEFWPHFRVLGDLVGGSWGYLGASWLEVGLSWAILA